MYYSPVRTEKAKTNIVVNDKYNIHLHPAILFCHKTYHLKFGLPTNINRGMTCYNVALYYS